MLPVTRPGAAGNTPLEGNDPVVDERDTVRTVKLLATSDLHVSYQDNRQVVEAIASPDENDWLIIAGDIGERFADIEWTLETLRPRFARLI